MNAHLDFALNAADGSLKKPPITAALFGEQLFREQTVVIFGDSITGQNVNGSDGVSAYGSASCRGYWTQAQLFLRHRFLLLNNAGITGNTTAQMLARIQADVIAYNPGYCIVEGGGNDVVTGVSSATTIANLIAIYDILISNGIVPVATTVLPTFSADTVGEKANLHAVNNWMRTYAPNRQGMIFCDWNPNVADPSTGDPATNMTYDAITHPSQAGAYQLGKKLADVLGPITVLADPLPFSNAETGLVLPNPRMQGGVTIAPSVSVVPNTGTPSLVSTKVARADGIQGQWQQVVASGAADMWFVQQQSTTNVGGGNVSAGDRIYGTAEVEIDPGATMVAHAGEVPCGLGIISQDGPGGAIWDNYAASGEGLYPGLVPSGRLVLRTPNFLVPVGASRLYQRVTFWINGTIRVGRMQIYKASASGIYG